MVTDLVVQFQSDLELQRQYNYVQLGRVRVIVYIPVLWFVINKLIRLNT